MAASEESLSSLHDAVARVLTHKMQVRDVQRVVKVGGEDTLVDETVEPTAAELAAAITFLKNNNITAVPDEDSALGELRSIMEKRRAKRPPALPDPLASIPTDIH